MITFSIKDKDIYKLKEETTNQTYYGGNQEWYTKRWQRLSGCGPTAVSNIIYYLNRTRNSATCCSNLTKNEYLNLMNEIWKFVTPSLGGISSTDMLCKGVNKYLVTKNLDIKLDSIDIPKKKVLRPDFQQVILFLMKALENDAPIAFLNLEHGSVLELDSWHWVTIVSLEYELDGSIAFVDILDGGFLKRIELSRWFETTKLGGGFVSFEL